LPQRRLDPKTNTASILSIPRDLFVPMPAGSPVGTYEKIDAALNDGKNGPDNLIQAITDDLGGDMPVPGFPTETLLQYAPTALPPALGVLDHLSGAVMLQSDSSLSPSRSTPDRC
jgi:hypothetical protein